KVALEIPWRRQTSSVLAPASCSRSTPMICSSLKRLPFIARLLFSGDGLYLISAEFSGCRPERSNNRQVQSITSTRSLSPCKGEAQVCHESIHRESLLPTVASPLRQPKDAFAQHVALDFVGAGIDHRAARFEHPARPDAVIDRESVGPFELRIRPQQLQREGCDPQSQFGGRQFDHRAFRPRRQSLELARELPETRVPNRGGLRRELPELLPHARLVPEDSPVA